ncbi:MAG: hypothetical protein WCP77_12265 [Roseococcus sp.]
MVTIDMLESAARMPAFTALLALVAGFLTLGLAVRCAVDQLPRAQ